MQWRPFMVYRRNNASIHIIYIFLRLRFLRGTVVFIIALLIFILKNKSFQDLEKLRPFECGFIPKEPARSLFSIHFFLIAILFLIFDVELVILFPLFSTFFWNRMSSAIFVTLLLILIAGLLYEWAHAMLDWSNLK